MDVYDEADDVEWSDVVPEYPAWTTDVTATPRRLSIELLREYIQKLEEEWKLPPKRYYEVISRKEYERRLKEEENR